MVDLWIGSPWEDCRCFAPPVRPPYLRRVKAAALPKSFVLLGRNRRRDSISPELDLIGLTVSSRFGYFRRISLLPSLKSSTFYNASQVAIESLIAGGKSVSRFIHLAFYLTDR
jgi:hypothetical protein